mmetsp:Transcript_10349/g.34255  ORF Transcript_10349/g.34255 Transcript_10349/m.34255 type:complete len:224 (+) Transcript_10349:1177-1848(+)
MLRHRGPRCPPVEHLVLLLRDWSRLCLRCCGPILVHRLQAPAGALRHVHINCGCGDVDPRGINPSARYARGTTRRSVQAQCQAVARLGQCCDVSHRRVLLDSRVGTDSSYRRLCAAWVVLRIISIPRLGHPGLHRAARDHQPLLWIRRIGNQRLACAAPARLHGPRECRPHNTLGRRIRRSGLSSMRRCVCGWQSRAAASRARSRTYRRARLHGSSGRGGELQ